MDNNDKLAVLVKIAKEFNTVNITWSLGASMLLFFKGITSEFHDIDIMITNEEADLAKEILLSLGGEIQPPNPNGKYKTKTFLEFIINGVDVDIMAGFAIVNKDILYDCSLQSNQIVEYLILNGEKIPLQSVQLWCTYYQLMERKSKVQLIKNADKVNGNFKIIKIDRWPANK